MLCLGNICRSPLSEILLQSKISTSHFVDSAGTINFHEGKKADARSIAVAQQHGLDLNYHRSRPIAKQDFIDFDLIFCMDQQNYNDALQLTQNQAQKQQLYLILDLLPIKNKNVPDPYYGAANGFEQVYNLLDEATDALVAKHQLGH